MNPTIVDVPGVKVGQAHDPAGLTGCTVIRVDGGAVCGVDVRGSAPGTRETDLLSPINLVNEVHAVCLSGGSAFGLDAASGVMRYLEEQAIGLNVGVGVVPIVPAAVLFDLALGDPKARPTADMGYEAAAQASSRPVAEGNVGAGCGATVGKMAGSAAAMKSGLGSHCLTLPSGLSVGAIVAVNAAGNIRDPESGQFIAGARDANGNILDLDDLLAQNFAPIPPGTNTTIAVVATNAKLTKAQATKVAQMAHDGLARCIDPVHTMYDGDTVFALATGSVEAKVDIVGIQATRALAAAVIRGVKAAKAAGGLPAYEDLSVSDRW